MCQAILLRALPRYEPVAPGFDTGRCRILVRWPGRYGRLAADAEPTSQRQQKQDPIERVSSAGDNLCDQRLPAPKVADPDGEFAAMPQVCLKLIPGENLVGHVGMIHPRELLGEDFPEESGHDEYQKEGCGQPSQSPAGRKVPVHMPLQCTQPVTQRPNIQQCSPSPAWAGPPHV